MDVRFEIKLGETTNKNFLVFISTELTKKLKYELQETDKLNWSFRKGDSLLNISDGYYREELCECEDRDRYGSRHNSTKIVKTFIDGVLVIDFKNVDSIDTVNSVFNIISKYANLIISENNKEENNEDELVKMAEEVAFDKE